MSQPESLVAFAQSTPFAQDEITSAVTRLTAYGVHISRELVGETDADTLARVLASLDDGTRQLDAQVLSTLAPKRAADKRQAIAQRRQRNG